MADRSQPGLGHACGVVGVYAPGQTVAQLAYLGLYALQRRGQESAGIAVSDGETITVVKDMGLVTQVFDERRLAPLDGHLAIGHNRYSTTGSSTWRNAQPVYRSVGDAGFALGHNGNLTNTAALAERLGMLPGLTDPTADVDSTTDSAMIAELVAQEYPAELRSDGRDLELALDRVLPRLAGGFSLVLMDEAHLIAVRDRHGFWPLVLGRVEDGGWVVASETAALDILGAHVVREVEPGEMIVIDASGLREHRFAEPSPSLCLFEFVYFARPDSYLYGRNVHAAAGAWARSSPARRRSRPTWSCPSPSRGSPRRRATRPRVRDPLRRRPGEEPLRRADLHRAEPAAAQRRGAPEAEPAARGDPRQAPPRRRGLDRAGHHHEAGRRHAPRGRRRGGAPAHLVAAVQVAVPLRDGHRATRRAARRRPVGRGDRRLPEGRLPRLPRAGPAHARDRCARRRVLHRVPLGHLPGARARGARLEARARGAGRAADDEPSLPVVGRTPA